jgi:hypothetical protein
MRLYENAPIKPKIQPLTFSSKRAMVTGIEKTKINQKTIKGEAICKFLKKLFW